MKKIILLTFVLICSLSVSAQKVKTADKLYRNFAYLEAAELYKEALAKNDSSAHLLTRIGDCYYKNVQLNEALKWYAKAAEKIEDVNPKFMYNYIQTLRGVGNNALADEWLERFKNYTPYDSLILNSKFTHVKGVETANPLLKLINLNSNTSFSDFGGFEDANGNFYFSSSVSTDLKSEENSNQIYDWNEEPYLKIYQSKISKSNDTAEVSNQELIVSDSISAVSNHQGTLAITKDGKTLYYTGSNVRKKNVPVYDRKGTNNLKIYRATLINGKWSNLTDLSINNKSYSTGHPTLSPDEKTLYFVSDKEGGYGQTDLYKVAINNDGSLGVPVNLGQRINTAGREMFPFVAKDSTLYFSSDGYFNNNFGLLDIYKSDLLKKGIADEVIIENLGPIFNSGYDDFAFFTNDDEKSGYLSSNRPDGKGSDDIYAFITEKCLQSIAGVTYDVLTNVAISGVKVQLFDDEGNELDVTTSSEDGIYIFENIDCEKTYKLIGSKIRHESDSKEVITTNIPDDEIKADLYLTPFDININPIYFDYDKSFIRPDAAEELDRVVQVMNDYPKMIIKIESHTDSRGRDAYNLALSNRRAKSTRDYIMSQGIDSSRIESAIGYGETQLINRCTNEFRNICSEEEHQLNRRSRFIIVNFDTFR
ncbi:OmpA family protein [Sabulilitoribacter multivorans]|uniref:OmpA family protein n=1 Tax=Flaviramulus multivorans TaxID=1304750 RepID=A0ABS9IEU8_9FLAO|nr:OmpA family protein [Flaviramulus multivorans]MCF7559301.1 OmpA family protein [Flaviramulus multivorans]